MEQRASSKKEVDEATRILKEQGLPSLEEMAKAMPAKREKMKERQDRVRAFTNLSMVQREYMELSPGIVSPSPACTLQALASAKLNEVTVTISGPYGVRDTVWNEGDDPVYFKVRIHNTSGCILREVFSYVNAYGWARIAPVISGGEVYFDGKEYWPKIDIDEEVLFYVRVGAAGAGNARLRAGLEAEVIPYAVGDLALLDDTIYPS